ncbi:MAG: PQQ-binding-like beta-propeller repeat protein [Planctomycetota bacterium]
MPRTTVFATIAATAALAGLAACSSSSNQAQTAPADERRTLAPDTTQATDEGLVTRAGELRINHDHWASAGYRWDWSARPRVERGGDLERVDVSSGLLLAQDTRGTLSAIETDSGRVRWAVTPANRLVTFHGATVVNNMVFVFARPSLYALDADTGTFLSRQEMDVVVATKPFIEGGLAVFGTPKGEVYGHEFGDSRGELLAPPLHKGRKAWGYQIDGAVLQQPVMVGGRIGVVSDTGTVFFVDPVTAAGVGSGRTYGGVDAQPVTDGLRLFAASRDQSVYAFNPNGQLVWRYPTAATLRAQPVVWNRQGDPNRSVLFVDIPGEGIAAFEGPTGEKLWANADAGGTVVSIHDGTAIAVEGETVTTVDLRDGSTIERFTVRGLREVVADGVVDADVYLLGDDGYIAKLAPRR